MGTFGEKERDMLVEVSANVKNICKDQKQINKDLRDHIAKDDQNVRKGIWMWVTAGLSTLFMALIMGAYTYIYNVDDNLGEHETDLTIHRTEGTVRAMKE